MSNSKELVAVVVNLGKCGDTTHSRAGYKDDGGQVFLPPKNSKRVKGWREKMESLGFVSAEW
jgi:hypothetical protein